MPNFEYTARKKNGDLIQASLIASDRKSALTELKKDGLTPIRLKENEGSLHTENPFLNALFKKFRSPNNRLNKDASQSMSGSTSSKGESVGLNLIKRLYELHKSGLPIGDAIRILQNRSSAREQKALATSLWRDLSEGIPLAKAMSNRSKYFSPSICHVIQAGEATGHLAPILNKVITYLEEKQAIRKKMIASMVYPSFVTSIALLVVVLFLTVLLPQIESMLDRLGGEMTWSARLLIDGSNLLIQFGPFILIALTLAFFGVQQWKSTKKGAVFLDALFLKMPLIGTIIYYSNLYQTGNLISTLLQSGINTTETLKLTEKTIENHSLKEKFIIAKSQVNEGVSITQAFRIQKFMPDIALDILGVGEDTGDLASSMEEITVGFKEQLTNRLSQMTTLVSSLALAFAFSLVTLIAIGIVTSIFQVSKTLSL